VNEEFPHVWQNVVGSVVPALAPVMSAGAQLIKQYIGPADSKDAQTSLKWHSPGAVQQSASD
jgi:hypothetical protein